LIPNFYSLYAHEFVRVACCVPRTRVADAEFNLGQTLRLAQEGDKARTEVLNNLLLADDPAALSELFFSSDHNIPSTPTARSAERSTQSAAVTSGPTPNERR